MFRTTEPIFKFLLLHFCLFTSLIYTAHAAVPSFDGTSKIMGAGTYPRSTRLSDNSLLGVYTAFENTENVIKVIRSTDNGDSWSAYGEVTRGVGDIDNGFLLQLSNGHILCAFRNHSKVNGEYTVYRITICISTDGGKNWAYLSTAETSGPPNGLWEPFMRIGNDGRVQLYYSRELASNDQDNLVRFSSDGGTSWSGSTIVSGSGITARDGMVGITKFNDGQEKLISIFETNEDGTFGLKSTTSSDDGATWGNRQSVYHATGTNNNAGAPQITNAGGNLVVSFMTDEDTSLHQWVTGASVKIITSTTISSGSISWGNKLTVGDVQSNWPGLMTLDSTHVLVMYDHGGAKSQRILLQ